jgi:Cytochrome C oxidase, cbb3-type, subunit III
MSSAHRWIAPVAAGAVAAGAAFAVVTVTADDGDRGERAGPPPSVSPGQPDGASGAAIFARMGCGSCHRLSAAGSNGEIGPDLDQRLRAHSPASLIAVITDSDRPGTFAEMPEDFGARMNAAELNALVDFLLAARNRPKVPG